MLPLADELENQLHHPTWGNGFFAVNVDTLRNTLILVAVLLGIALLVRSQFSEKQPKRTQVVLEGIADFVSTLVRDTLGAKEQSIRLAPLAVSMFFFLLLANWMGLIPGFKSPTNDINTVAGLALFSIGMLHVQSIRWRGFFGYIKHYFSVVTPSWRNPAGALARVLFALLEVIQEVSRPITLTCRLYFNIFAGEFTLALLIVVFGAVAVVIGPIWIGFSLFIGVIQAFIFTMLTIAYIHMGTEVSHASHEEEHAA